MDSSKFVRVMFDKGIIKFGDYRLKSGLTSPFYVNLRKVFSVPDLR